MDPDRGRDPESRVDTVLHRAPGALASGLILSDGRRETGPRLVSQSTLGGLPYTKLLA